LSALASSIAGNLPACFGRSVVTARRLRGGSRSQLCGAVLLGYVDESYDQRRYWIACLLCPQDELNPLTTALDEVVSKAAQAYSGLNPTAELHGHAIFHGKDDWAPLAPMVRARIGVYHDAFAAIGASQAQVIIRGVNVPGLKARYVHPNHPHAVVLEHLLERIDEEAERQNDLALRYGAAIYSRPAMSVDPVAAEPTVRRNGSLPPVGTAHRHTTVEVVSLLPTGPPD
jgi:hypothetical protein